MKKIITQLLIFLLVFSISAIGQRITYHQNTNLKLFIKCEQPPRFGSDSTSLQVYLNQVLSKQIKRKEGNIKISAIIDTIGKATCLWIENNSNLNLKKIKLDAIIDSMPAWTSGIQNGYKVNCEELIFLDFGSGELTVSYKLPGM